MRKYSAIALVQVVTGGVGLVIVAVSYFYFAPRVRESIRGLDRFVTDAQTELTDGKDLLVDWQGAMEQIDSSLERHRSMLVAGQKISGQLDSTIEQWEKSAQGFAKIGNEGSEVVERFATFLPLEVPIFDIKQKKMEVKIPTWKVEKQKVEIPYPTAKLGTRKKKIDLGLTQVDLDVPSLQVGRSKQTIEVPAPVKVEYRSETVALPEAVDIKKQTVLGEEKELLVNLSKEMSDASVTLEQTGALMGEVRGVVKNELDPSLRTAIASLDRARESLATVKDEKVPDLKRTLKNQAAELKQNQLRFQSSDRLIELAAVLAAILPFSVLLQGLGNLNGGRVKDADRAAQLR